MPADGSGAQAGPDDVGVGGGESYGAVAQRAVAQPRPPEQVERAASPRGTRRRSLFRPRHEASDPLPPDVEIWESTDEFGDREHFCRMAASFQSSRDFDFQNSLRRAAKTLLACSDTRLFHRKAPEALAVPHPWRLQGLSPTTGDGDRASAVPRPSRRNKASRSTASTQASAVPTPHRLLGSSPSSSPSPSTANGSEAPAEPRPPRLLRPPSPAAADVDQDGRRAGPGTADVEGVAARREQDAGAKARAGEGAAAGASREALALAVRNPRKLFTASPPGTEERSKALAELRRRRLEVLYGDDEALSQQRRMLSGQETTLLIQNISAEYSLMQLSQEFLLNATANLFFLPRLLAQRLGSGCAIINFTCEEAASSFWKKWQGQYLLLQGQSPAPLRMRRARTQGLKANLAKITKFIRAKQLQETSAHEPDQAATTARGTYSLMLRTDV